VSHSSRGATRANGAVGHRAAHRVLEEVDRVLRRRLAAVFGDRDRGDAGTSAPFSRASFKPMAMACLRLRTRAPEPLFNVPALRLRIADATVLSAVDFRFAIVVLPRCGARCENANDVPRHATRPPARPVTTGGGAMTARRPPLGDDVNLRIAGLLGDMAAIQTAPPKRFAYRQAAASIRDLDAPLDRLVAEAGSTLRIPRIGPSSLRIIAEALTDGDSATVAAAVAASGRSEEIARRQTLRQHFLSRAAARAVLQHAGAYPGFVCDLQMHSTWSDGRQTLAGIAAACLARGYTHAGVTDHAAGLAIANGVTMERFAAQWREIDAINRRSAGRFRLLKSVEANIDGDGGLDVVVDDRRRFDLVLAAPHSGLRSERDQTARMIAAVTAPHVHVLAHPRGRKFATRPGIRADWPRVFAAAAHAGVAVEIDGDPSRQDLDHTAAAAALDAGCVMALDSDAHAERELGYVEMAMAHARLAGIPPERVINCWPLDHLLAWAERRG
jgi:putative hydrolase